MKLMVLGRSWGRRSLSSAGIWLGSLLVAGGCRAESPVPQTPAQPQGSSLHWSVPLVPGVKPRDPVLWVALAAHLRPPEPLRLSSAKGNLTLVTSTGRRISAPGLVLGWQMQPLPEPLQISRQVLGPFASFETAETAAQSWRQQGAQAVVAHPGEWEVWAPLGSPPPAVGKPRLWQQLQRQRQVLVLASPLAAGGASGSASSVLEGPLKIDAPGGLRWKGGVYAGPFRLQGDAYGSWSLVEQVPLERYLLGVVPHEIGAGAPAAALQAQAVLARTWALRNQGRFAVDGYHLCADTQCQVYGDPRGAGAAVKRAVVATQSLVLSWAGQPIHAVYHASNGGVSAGFGEAWGGAGFPYLKPAIDAPSSGPQSLARRFPLPLGTPSVQDFLAHGGAAYGADHSRFRWTRSLDAAQIGKALAVQAPQVGLPQQVDVLRRGASGRVLALKIVGQGGEVVLYLDAIRRTLRPLPSTLFVVQKVAPGQWLFEGGGFGHGAGLSQAGAMDLAQRGWGLQQILQHYYPGTNLQPLAGLQPPLPPPMEL